MLPIFLTVPGNTAPAMALTLQHDGTNIDLTNATVTFVIHNTRTGEVTNTGHQSAELTDAINGLIKYSPNANDFPVEGLFVGDVHILYADTKVETIFEQAIVVAR